MKKTLLMMLITMLVCMAGAVNVFAADGDYEAKIVLTPNVSDYTESEGIFTFPISTSYKKFAEPTVKVQKKEDGIVTDLTHLYNIKYYISGHESDAEASMTLNHRNAKVTTDATTGTQVELLFGDVITGENAGNVTISIKATERANTGNVLSASYKLNVQAPAPIVSFSPAFAKSGDDDVINLSVMQTVKDEYNNNLWHCRLSSASATFPNIRIIYKDEDITDKYTINKNLTKGDANSDYTLSVKTNKYDDQDYEQIVFTEFNKYSIASEEAAKAYFPSDGAYITYTFTPQSGYPVIADKVVKINFNKFVEKQNLTLSLTQDLFSDLQNVTSHKNANNEDIYTIHVYKYGAQDHSEAQKYHYYQPHPTLTNTSGTSLPVNASRCAGTYGDFKYLYEVYDGNNGTRMSSSVVDAESVHDVLLGTYYDDCQVAPFQAGTDYTKAGQSTGMMATSDYMFQSSKPGLVLVKVYAVLEGVQHSEDEYVYGYDLRKLYNPVMENGQVKVIEQNYTQYTVYSKPVYYYIDVMKRIPTLSFDPNPNDLTFGKNDRIDMTNRFNVSGYKDDSSNGIEGKLVWGGNDGFESDHFAYTFFISQHAAQVIKIHDWPCTFTKEVGGHTVADSVKWAANSWTHPATGEVFHGDQYSFISYQVVKSTDPIANNVNAYLMPGDYKLLDNGDYELVTVGNQDHVKAGDKIKGITYNSVKGYGAAFEQWYMTFEHEGQYNITYTIRPWNHVRWDVGDDTAGTTTYHYNIVETMPTEIKLSYYETTTSKNAGSDFDEPNAKVVVTSSQNDVSSHFDFSYAIDPNMPHDGLTGYTITEDEGWSVYKKGSDVVLKVNTTTGEVFVGDIVEDVKVQVSATKKGDSDAAKYENPAPKSYLIHIMDLSGNAKWEIISTCDPVNDTNASTNPRFTPEEFEKQSGRFHFIGAGSIVGGTQVRDVPGIVMTIGASGDVAWNAEISPIEGLKHCCAHEDINKSATEGNPVIIDGGIVSLNDEGIPTNGTFYQFQPTASGFLALDANWQLDNVITLITKNSKTGVVSSETYTVSAVAQDDHLFTMPLIAGETYYVYNSTTGTLRLHGFTYQPAYVANASTTKTQSETGIEGTLFMNGFVTGVPTLVSGKNENVVYSFFKETETSETADHSGVFNADASDYAEINPETGALTAKKMTIKDDGSIFYLKVVAAVKSSNSAWGTCTEKETFYYVRIIDIPTYKIDNYEEYSNNPVYNRMKVRTTNIPTALTMTFGAWSDDDEKYNTSKTDQWSYKSVGGPASRIGSELEDDNPTYNLTIDGFTYFNAGNNNPIDEHNKGALIAEKDSKGNAQVNNGNSYKYASGTAAEKSTDTYYNTTYKLPCRGAFVKFEPEESGTLLVYVVQNGSCDYHYGIEEVSEQYKLKWRPFYITDETGKPVDMLNALGDNVSSLLPMDNTDDIDIGAYTLGLSRCNKIESAIQKAMTAKGITPQAGVDVCSFDWSEFRGTQEGADNDRSKLLSAWPNKGKREKVIRLSNGGFALPHKAYVRYAFNVKAGKTYFVFQPGSKFEFSGFSFVPVGYPANSKYGLTWTNKPENDSNSNMWNWTPSVNGHNQETSLDLNWKSNLSDFTAKENVNVTLWDEATEAKTKNRTFSKDKWNSICLPFSVSETQLKKKFGDKYVLVTVDGMNSKGQLQFTRHANGYIEAGRPYLFLPSIDCKAGADQTHLTFENVTIEAGTQVDLSLKDQHANIIDPTRFNVELEGEGYTFLGFYTQHLMPKGSVYAAKEGLYMNPSDGNIGGYRALFHFGDPNPTNAKALTFCINDLTEYKDEDQTTGIVYVTADEVKTFSANPAVYTIDGKMLGRGADVLNKLGKGIYIVDGQKIAK